MWKDYLCRDSQAWDAYVISHPECSSFHQYGWSSVIKKRYGHDCYYLALPAETGVANSLSAILPLVHFHQPDGPNRMVSLPYLDYAGLAADDERSKAQLLQAAFSLARELGVVHIELRQDASYPLSEQGIGGNDWQRQTFKFKVGLSRSLPADKEDLWQDLGPKVRNQVRKAEKNGCQPAVGGEELLASFYTVFATNMRDLGSPVHSYDFLLEVLTTFRESVRIVLIEKDGLPVAGAIVFRKGNTLYNPWASSLRAYRPLCPNMLLYWTMLSWGCDQGIEMFDFGRSSPGATTYRFKKQWGAKSRPLQWEVFSVSGRSWHPEQESLCLPGWSALPLAETKMRGPQLRRWISL